MDKPVNQPLGKGVRYITVFDQAPSCEIKINDPLFELSEICRNKKVVDIGCGYGRTRKIVESVGGTWTGVEPFEGGAHTVVASAENLPFENESFDVVIMTSVMEHIPNPELAFKEIGRILKKGGVFVGYMAFMECFHEISYAHLSWKAIENYSQQNGMKLEAISGGRRFGIDYHIGVLLSPLPTKRLRAFIAFNIRCHLKLKSKLYYFIFRYKEKLSSIDARSKSELFYKVECLRQSNGFNHIIRKV